jgi:hypothetical protein
VAREEEKMRFAVGVAAAAMLGSLGCGSEDEGGPSGPAPANEDMLVFETGEFVVPTGDSFECFYLEKFTDQEYSVNGAYGTQGPGGHHVLVFYAEEPRPAGHHPCTDAEMTNLRQVAGSAGQDNTQDDVLGLGENMAIRVPKGKQLVIQAHYINTSGKEMTANDVVGLRLMKPAEVSEYVSYLVTLDDSFEVPPQTEHTHVTYCDVFKDFKAVLTLGHMHEAGRRYALEVVDEADEVLQTVRDDVWAPEFTSHPPIDHFKMAAPLLLEKGTTLRQTCTWQNDTAEPMVFPREMCLSFMYYYPEEGDVTLNCYEKK